MKVNDFICSRNYYAVYTDYLVFLTITTAKLNPRWIAWSKKQNVWALRERK